VAINIEERRRRRDQKLAVQAATDIVQQAATQRRQITLEWACISAMVLVALALGFTAWHRHLPPQGLGSLTWTGFVLGGLLCHAGLQEGKARLTYLGLAVFAGLPLALIPFHFFSPEPALLPVLALAAFAGALFAAALRWAWQVRATAGALRDSLASMRESIGEMGAAVAAWLHDVIVRAIFSLFLIGVGSGAMIFGRQQQRELVFWAGAAIIFLIGSVGLWAPGLYSRSRLPVAIRSCGQLCFWLSLLVLPFLEPGPDGALPYTVKPSLRFAAMGLGLILIGATWFLQRQSIFSHQVKPEPKAGPERVFSLAVVILGLLVTFLGADARQRMSVTVDGTVVSETNLLGRITFHPADEVQSVIVLKPLEGVPFLRDVAAYAQLQFPDGSSQVLLPLLYPGEQRDADNHGLLKALRSAAQLNAQTFPMARVERWSR